MHVLRSEPEVTHDWQASRGELSNGIGDSAATFQLHCRGVAFLEEPCRIAHGLLRRNLIREKWHIGHHQRAVCTSGDRACVMNHYVQSDWDRCVQSHDHISEGITDEQQVDPGSIEQPRHRGIVSGQHDDPVTALFHQCKIRYTNLFGRGRSHDRLMLDSFADRDTSSVRHCSVLFSHLFLKRLTVEISENLRSSRRPRWSGQRYVFSAEGAASMPAWASAPGSLRIVNER